MTTIKERLTTIETDIKWIKKMMYAVIGGIVTTIGMENKELIAMFIGVGI